MNPVSHHLLLLICFHKQNTELKRLATRDPMTNCLNRRSFFERMEKAFTLAQSEKNPLSCVMVDIDHFKKFNDTYGHQVGDQLLRMVGSKLSVIGGGGTAFRYGGEEFTLLFPGKRVKQAMPHIESVMRTIRETPFTIRGPRPVAGSGQPAPPAEPKARQKVHVTVSIGVASARTPDEVVGDADRALYRAKKTGRDRIVGLVAGAGSANRPGPKAG